MRSKIRWKVAELLRNHKGTRIQRKTPQWVTCIVFPRFSSVMSIYLVSSVGIERGAHGQITKTVDAIVHARNEVQIQDGHFIQLSAIDAALSHSIYLRRDNDRG